MELQTETDQNTKGHVESDFSAYGFSIFQELFRTADTESKLILLDEVLAIGDEKEWYFLTTLADDPSKQVREKAARVQKELESRLSFETLGAEDTEDRKEEGLEASAEIQGPLFELDFELDLEYAGQSDDTPNQNEWNTALSQDDANLAKGNLMSQFLSLSHKILEKIYG